MFTDLQPAPGNPLLALSKLFTNDDHPDKVDLGIGVYKDEYGNVSILPSVKQAEIWLVENQTTKRYLSSAGNEDYNHLTKEILLGSTSGAFKRGQTIQTPGGTGALRVAADFLLKLRPAGRIFIPTPTWANHKAIFGAAGHTIIPYPYYDIQSGKLLFEGMMSALADMNSDDILLLHGCCHNPSGADPDINQWTRIAELLETTGATPLIDIAYLGFGEGFEADSAGIRLLAERLPSMIIASSYSKNFALYRERVGALTLIAENTSNAELALNHLLPVVRSNYSMPPDHGAAVVAHILGTTNLRQQWENEVGGMRKRINNVRHALVENLAKHCDKDYSFLSQQRGMFALPGISPESVKVLRDVHHVHITSSGRLNVAGLTEQNVEQVAKGIASIS